MQTTLKIGKGRKNGEEKGKENRGKEEKEGKREGEVKREKRKGREREEEIKVNKHCFKRIMNVSNGINFA